MRIFLSYDDTRRDVAQRLALGLRVARHRVFFDQDSLPAGTSYDDRIRRGILRSRLFVFLISRESLSMGAYALTELAIAAERWRHPTGRVLPVLLDDTPIPSLPPYLRAVSVLVPRGDVVADILNAVARLDAERRRRLLGRIGAGTIAALGIAAAIAFSGLLPPNGAPGEDGPAAESVIPAESVAAVDSATADSAQSSTAALDDELNPRTWKLKNGRHVRLVGDIVANQSNVADNIVTDAVEFSAWRYNRCYDDAYGHLSAALPEGAIIVGFEIRDQLPRSGSVERSDFTGSDFNECVVGTLIGQTINAAGAAGAGRVTYSFRFLPN